VIEPIVIGATLGFAASAHCVAMCGPLAAGGCTRDGVTRPRLAIEYALGRLFGYATLGGVTATLGRPLVGTNVARAAQIAAALGVAIVLGVTAVRWMRRPRAETSPLVSLRAGSRTRGGRILDHVPRRGLGLGLVTSLFPCGALASGVLAAAASGSWPAGVALMAAFALASSPALGVVVLFGDRVVRLLRAPSSHALRAAAGVAMLGIAAWIAAAPIVRAAHASPKPSFCCHGKG
jgi:sulfite exporter TauE/SafE